MRMTDGTASSAGLPRSWSCGCSIESRAEHLVRLPHEVLCRARPPYVVLRHGEMVRRPRCQTFRVRSAISGLAANPAALYVATPPTLELGVHTRTLDEPISRSAAAPATVIARP
jgi:hypothetical protein